MKYSVLKFFIFVGIVGIIASSVGAVEFEDRRGMSEAVANIYEYTDSYAYYVECEEIEQLELYKTLCIAGVVASLILTSACIVAHTSGKSADEKKAKATTNTVTNATPRQPSAKERLTELENLKSSKLITEKEYTAMRKEILETIQKGNLLFVVFLKILITLF